MTEPPRAVVVDASVAVKWHLQDEQDTQAALQLLDDFAHGQTELLAPAHIRYEVASALTVATTRQSPRLSREEGRQALGEFLALGLQVVDDDALIQAAYALVHQYGCVFYDALYLALAQHLQLPLVTADRRFYDRIKQWPDVLWIGDYPTPDAR